MTLAELCFIVATIVFVCGRAADDWLRYARQAAIHGPGPYGIRGGAGRWSCRQAGR